MFALLLLTGLTLVLVWCAQTFFLDYIYIDIKRSELVKAGEQLYPLTEEDDISGAVERLGYEKNICIIAYRLNDRNTLGLLGEYESKPNCNCLLHRLLTVSGFLPGGIKPDNREIVINAIKNASKKNGWAYVDSTGVESQAAADETLTLVVTVSDEHGTIAYFLNASVVPLESTTEVLGKMMIFLSGIVILCSIIFAVVIGVWITEPIRKINRTAKQLAECNYDVTFEEKGYQEIAELAQTLNYAADELSKVGKLKDELIANISHDLRTPLTLITGYAEAMRDLPDENTEENLQIIIDEGNRMKALVNDVLDISKLGSGTADMNFNKINLTNSIESELTRYNKLRDKEGFTIEFRYGALVTVEADYNRIMQVLYNLVNNAVNYSREDKNILVEQTVKKDMVRISVTDHGEGIAEEQLPLIWDRYYKADKTHKRATVGSGLGLSIVKDIVAAHNGECGVTSTLGEGSTFWFELKLLSATPVEDSDS